ncbi:MAG: potassium channel family protein [Candidatus Margulisbacteria bacterium]|nr:potassium channel family protein [Candidatus Margulisiibacteriota bacterium]
MSSFQFLIKMNPLRRLIIPGVLLLAIVIVGVVGYVTIEGWTLIDALYMVVITLSTVGFREVHDLNAAGRILTIGIILTGVATALYIAGQVIEMIVEGQIIGYRRRKKMEVMIREMKNHFIVCGFGRVGHQVAIEFNAANIPYVVIDSKPEVAQELDPQGVPHLLGDITSDAILKEAGILQARGLIASADSDTANVFVTLSARVLNPELYIIARAGFLDSEEKLKKAGANRVISPYFTAGKHMAEIAIKHRAE